MDNSNGGLIPTILHYTYAPGDWPVHVLAFIIAALLVAYGSWKWANRLVVGAYVIYLLSFIKWFGW